MKRIKLSFLLVSAATVIMAAESENLLTNGGFESGTKGWTLSVTKTDSADAKREIDSSGTAKEGKYFHRITVNRVSSENWHVQLLDPTWTAQPNYVYHFSMWARADSLRKAQISVYGNQDDNTAYRTSTGIDLTTEWKQYHMMFTSDASGAGQINFAMVCGMSTGIYDIDDVIITESENNAGSIYTNGGFEADGAGWTLWVNKNDSSTGAATVSYPEEGAKSGSKFCRINVTSIPKESWEVQLQDGTWESKLDGEYTYTFWAKADNDTSSIQVAVNTGSSRNYEYLTGQNFNLTTEWTEYNVPYTASTCAGADSLSFNIYCGYNLGAFDFDDISLTKAPVSIRNFPANSNYKMRQFSVRPLPGQLQFTPNTNTSINRITIQDVQGRVFYSKLLDKTVGNSYNLPRPPSGTWIIRANFEQNEQIQKIVLP